MLNYNHLYYFYVTARESSITKASELLHITPQTISTQISSLEQQMETQLFDRIGKRLSLNHDGKLAFEYAQEIFSSGQELTNILKHKMTQSVTSLTLGITDAMPKFFAFDMIKPVIEQFADAKLSYREGDLLTLLEALSVNKIDLILSDKPLPNDLHVSAYNHYMGQSGLSFFAAPKLLQNITGEFPKSLKKQPMLIPSFHATIHEPLKHWFLKHALNPNIVADFDDNALLNLFGQQGLGIFCAPTCIQKDLCQQYEVQVIGETDEINEQFYLISPEKSLLRPISQALFQSGQALLNR